MLTILLLCIGCLIIEVHDHRPPSVSQKSAFPTPPTPHKRLVNSNAANSPDAEASTSVFNTDSSARVLGGNYGFLRRLGADSHQRNGDQSGAGGSSSPSVYRIVLYPSAETLWTDLRMLNEIEGAGLWRDEDVLEIESRILVSKVQYQLSLIFLTRSLLPGPHFPTIVLDT
jgi:transcription factor SPT20